APALRRRPSDKSYIHLRHKSVGSSKAYARLRWLERIDRCGLTLVGAARQTNDDRIVLLERAVENLALRAVRDAHLDLDRLNFAIFEQVDFHLALPARFTSAGAAAPAAARPPSRDSRRRRSALLLAQQFLGLVFLLRRLEPQRRIRDRP